jgi:hypothetical protein
VEAAESVEGCMSLIGLCLSGKVLLYSVRYYEIALSNTPVKGT